MKKNVMHLCLLLLSIAILLIHLISDSFEKPSNLIVDNQQTDNADLAAYSQIN